MSVIGIVVAGILSCSLLLLIYSLLSRKKAIFYMLKFMIIVTLLVTPILAAEEPRGLIGIPPVTLDDKPIVIVGDQIVLGDCKNLNAEQDCWFEGVVDFLTNSTLNSSNQTYEVM